MKKLLALSLLVGSVAFAHHTKAKKTKASVGTQSTQGVGDTVTVQLPDPSPQVLSAPSGSDTTKAKVKN